MLPTIEYLKDNNTGIYYFGLGFIQVKIGDDVRYNFYHPELTPCFVKGEEIHTHPYDFESHILKGCLEEFLYNVTPTGDGDWEMCSIDCKGTNTKLFPCNVDIDNLLFHIQGQSYERSYATLHSVVANVPTVTKLTKKLRYGKAFALMPNGKDCCSPFISYESEERCWEVVEEILS